MLNLILLVLLLAACSGLICGSITQWLTSNPAWSAGMALIGVLLALLLGAALLAWIACAVNHEPWRRRRNQGEGK